MKAQARYERRGRATQAGENPRASLQRENRDRWQRFSLSLLGGLLCAGLFFSATGQAIASQPGREVNSPGLLAVLSAQTQEAVLQSHRFVNDLRLLYQISQLEPLETESVATPRVAPAAPAEPECKLISAPQRTIVLVKLDKARS